MSIWPGQIEFTCWRRFLQAWGSGGDGNIGSCLMTCIRSVHPGRCAGGSLTCAIRCGSCPLKCVLPPGGTTPPGQSYAVHRNARCTSKINGGLSLSKIVFIFQGPRWCSQWVEVVRPHQAAIASGPLEKRRLVKVAPIETDFRAVHATVRCTMTCDEPHPPSTLARPPPPVRC